MRFFRGWPYTDKGWIKDSGGWRVGGDEDMILLIIPENCFPLICI